MGGTKRRHGGSAKKAPAAATATQSYSNAISRTVSTLLDLHDSPQAVKRLWDDESSVRRVSDTYSSEPSVETVDSDDALGYYLLIAAQLLERLAKNPSGNAIAMAWLAYAMAPLAVPPGGIVVSSRETRHVGGRALLACTAAANHALLHLTSDSQTKGSVREAMAIVAALLALDVTCGAPESHESLGLSSAVNVEWAKSLQIWNDAKAAFQTRLNQYWQDLESKQEHDASCWDEKMEQCWLFLTDTGRSRTRSTMGSVSSVFANGIDKFYLISDYGNISSRWVIMILSLQGEPRWIETALALLQGPWKEYWTFALHSNRKLLTDQSSGVPDKEVISPSKKRRAQDTQDPVRNIDMPGRVAAIALASQLLRLLVNSNKSVDRKFRDSLKLYVSECWSVPYPPRVCDVRDAGAVLLFEMLSLHQECLELLSRDNDHQIVNDEDEIQDRDPIARYFPFVNQSLEKLVICISNSPSLSLQYDSQTKVKHRMEGLILAFTFQFFQGSTTYDARLLLFSGALLSSALKQSYDASDSSTWLSKKVNKTPLATPAVTQKKKTQKRTVRQRSSYGGLFPAEFWSEDGGDAKVVLLLRSIDASPSWAVRCQVLMTLMLNIIETLYGTSGTDFSGAPIISSTYSNERQAKRLKTELRFFGRKSETRAACCSTALDVLSLCFRTSLGDHTLTHLQALFRPNLKNDHILRVIRLEAALKNMLPIINVKMDKTEASEQATTTILNDFYSAGETKLWKSHLNACIVLGRGRLTYRSEDKKSFFGSQRLDVYKEVAKLNGTSHWPLSLPASHRMIISSNLASETRSPTSETEIFIVEGAIESIKACLSLITNASCKRAMQELEVSTCYDEEQLSLEECRLILSALAILDTETRGRLFHKLVSMFLNWIKGLYDQPDLIGKVCQNPEAIGFVGRVVTFCGNAYSVLRLGPSVRRELIELLGSSQQPPPQLPSYIAVSSSSRKCFMGVWGNPAFSDDCSSRLILQDVDSESEKLLEELLLTSFRLGFQTVEKDSGHVMFAAWNVMGKCELWNLTREIKSLPADFAFSDALAPSLILELRNEVCFVERLRRGSTGKSSSVSALSAAIESRARADFGVQSVSGSFVESLSSMVDKGTDLIELLLERSKNDSSAVVSRQVFCLLRVLVSYLCYAVSACTEQVGDDLFLRMSNSLREQSRKRGRAYSTESEVSASDTEDSVGSQDILVGAFERLQYMCKTIGAAPVHPDWLDTDCKFVEGMSSVLAIEIGQKALRQLASLLATSISLTNSNQKKLLKSCRSVRNTDDVRLTVILNACWVENLIKPSSMLCNGVISSKLGDLLGSFEHTSCEDIRLISQLLCPGVIATEQAFPWWQGAAQRVHGRLLDLFKSNALGRCGGSVSVAQLRATGEWEMILAKCLDAAPGGLSALPAKCSLDSQTYFQASSWLSVTRELVDCMAPFSAFLRFGLEGGRISHPFVSLGVSTGNPKYISQNFRHSLLHGKGLSEREQRLVTETLSILSLATVGTGADAAAAHLIPDEKSFFRIKLQNTTRLMLECIANVHLVSEDDGVREDGQRFIVDGMLTLSGEFGNIGREDEVCTANVVENIARTILTGIMPLDEVGGTDTTLKLVDYGSALEKSRHVFQPLGAIPPDFETAQIGLLSGLIPFIWPNCRFAGLESRAILVAALSQAVRIAYDYGKSQFIFPVIQAFEGCSENDLASLFSLCVCKQTTSQFEMWNSASHLLKKSLCSLFLMILVVASSTNPTLHKAGVVLKVVLDSINNWNSAPWSERICILDMLVGCSLVTRSLKKVSERLLLECQKPSAYPHDIESLAYLCRCFTFLQVKLRPQSQESIDMESQDEAREVVPSICTYVKFSDFHEQHWYQCYTCGLTGDRGCCSLCAIVCHKGHDVSYARHSSFFCDCGAERSNADSNLSVSCKCVSPPPANTIRSSLREHQTSFCKRGEKGSMAISPNISDFDLENIKSTVGLFMESSLFKAEWSASAQTVLFRQLKSDVAAWDSENLALSTHPMSPMPSLSGMREALYKGSQGSIRACVSRLSHRTCYEQGSLNMNISATKRSYLAGKNIGRCALQADLRGRLVIGEANSVLFCNGSVAINPGQNADHELKLSRQSLRIFKSIAVSFDILGICLSPVIETKIAVWGMHSVTVLLMHPSLQTCEKCLDIGKDFKQSGKPPDSILKCLWLPGSPRYLLVASPALLILYDTCDTNRNPLEINTSSEEVNNAPAINDVAVVRVTNHRGTESWKVFILVRGILHEIGLLWRDGELGSAQNEPREVAIPWHEGILVPPGRIVRISILSQSRILLCHCEDGPSYGLCINAQGVVTNARDFLPESLQLTVSGSVLDVTGPFTSWTELGLVEGDDSQGAKFRISCVGKVTTTNYPLLLSLDLCEEVVAVGALKIYGYGEDGKSASPALVDGSALVSVPFCKDDQVAERIYVCIVTGHGTCSSYANDSSLPLIASISPPVSRKGEAQAHFTNPVRPDIPLLAFESLINISDDVDIIGDGGATESDSPPELNSKLSRDNDSFVRSPGIDGCTLSLSLKKAYGLVEVPSRSDHVEIVSVRLLFGATSFDAIPRFVCVQGTRIDIIPGMKRWYAVHLSLSDVLMGIRSRFVSIFIGPTFDGSASSIIDGLETFGMPRRSLQEMLPTAASSIVASPIIGNRLGIGCMQSPTSARLRSILEALSLTTKYSDLNPQRQDLSDISKLIQKETFRTGDVTTFQCLQKLLSSVFSSEEAKMLKDETLVSACSEYVEHCQQILTASALPSETEDAFRKWQSMRPRLRAYMKAAVATASRRPSNYFKTIQLLPMSPALKVCETLSDFIAINPINVDFISDSVQLSLLECAIARMYGDDFGLREKLAGFDALCRFFMSSSLHVARAACLAVTKFCQKYCSTEALENDESDLFASYSMAVFYRCDGCSIVPIEKVRYALQDEDHPIDLCLACFEKANLYAKAKKFNHNEDVVLGKQESQGGLHLTCAEVGRMEAHPIQTHRPSSGSDSMEDGAKNSSSHEVKAQLFQRKQLFGDFVESMTTVVVNLLSCELEKKKIHVSVLISLINDLSTFLQQTSKSDRITRLSRKATEGLAKLLFSLLPQNNSASKLLPSDLLKVHRYTEALNSMIVPDKNARSYLIAPSGDVDLIETLSGTERPQCFHGINAVRRQIPNATGTKGYYICGVKSKAHRCNFLVSCETSGTNKPLFNENAANSIWCILSKQRENENFEVQELLCSVLKHQLDEIDKSGSEKHKVIQQQRKSRISSLLSDFDDGVFCSQLSFHIPSFNWGTDTVLLQGESGENLEKSECVQSILDLIALAGGKVTAGDWEEQLCRILLSSDETFKKYQPSAKRALFQLCERSPSAFLEARDRYIFKLQVGTIWDGTRDQRNYAIMVNQKSRMHSAEYRHLTPSMRDRTILHVSDIVGATDLISEDVLMCDSIDQIGKALDDVTTIALKRPKNWKAFCSTQQLSWKEKRQVQQSDYFPLFDILLLPALLVGENRAKAMRLASLCASNDQEPLVNHLPVFTENDIFAFAIRFVCNDECQEVRRFALKTVHGLCQSSEMAGNLLTRLLNSQSSRVGIMGRFFHEFLSLLNMLARDANKGNVRVAALAAQVGTFYCQQCTVMTCDRIPCKSYHFETRKSNSTVQKHRFELATCAHIFGRPSSNSKAKRHVDQVSPPSRFRLSTGQETACSDEFNHYLALPCRSVVSEFHIEINEPRGRFVKRVNVYYSPRPVDSHLDLKKASYKNHWKLCGELEVEKAIERVTCQISQPIVAANLRVHFVEFYDRPGAKKDGSFSIYCPRCMRVVTNAHGVCENCGEVALQCRKCRHLSYERHNAFLCSECGYSSCAQSISYDVTAAVATNAIAITNDRDYKRTMAMFESASRICEELCSSLQESLEKISYDHVELPKDGSSSVSANSTMMSPSIERAFQGELPLRPISTSVQDSKTSQIGTMSKRGSVVKLIARTRKDSQGNQRALRSEHTILRHIRGLDAEDFDDASVLLGGLIENSGISRGLDPSDPVSRLLATVQRQRERTIPLESSNDQQKGVARPIFDDSERLYRLVHEAQRECFALERRLHAWQRLEKGDLLCTDAEGIPMQPSRCSVCANLVAQQFLTLWQSLFLLDPEAVFIGKGFLMSLLDDRPPTAESLHDIKREVAKDIAIKSNGGRKIILSVLRSRILNWHCAEIVRKVLKASLDDPDVAEPFLSLTNEALGSGALTEFYS